MPAEIPVTRPVSGFTLTTPAEGEDHTPPGAVLLSNVVAPVHTVGTPVIAGGTGFTVTTAVL